MVLERLGRGNCRNNRPNGVNINVDCGSTHPEVVQQVVLKEGRSAFPTMGRGSDHAVDELGTSSMGTHLGHVRHGSTRVGAGKAIAATVYSNMALRDLFASWRIGGHHQTGDRHVLEAMQAQQYGRRAIRGTSFLEQNTTGDGI